VAFKTFTAGAVLTASDVNTYLAKQAVVVCTSTTRPSSPPEGMVIYETDTDKLLTYVSASTGWVPPWNQPWGIIAATAGGTSGYAYATVTTNSASFGTSMADITFGGSALSLTFTAVSNRRLKITTRVKLTSSLTGSGSVTQVVVADGSNNTIGVVQQQSISASSSDDPVFIGSVITSPSSGSVTYKLRGYRVNGTGTITALASAADPMWMLIEDIGPAGAPA
jgi:hypothetical protein